MNPTSLKALTWGTVITALVSALLLAAAGGMLPDREEASPRPAGAQPASVPRQAKATAGKRTLAGASATDSH